MRVSQFGAGTEAAHCASEEWKIRTSWLALASSPATAVIVVAVLALLILFVVEVLQAQPELMG